MGIQEHGQILVAPFVNHVLIFAANAGLVVKREKSKQAVSG